MDQNSNENLLQRMRDYSAKKRSQSVSVLEKETMHIKPAQPRSMEQSDIEYDSALFEPTNNESDQGVFFFYVFQ